MLFKRLFSRDRSWNDYVSEGQAALESGGFQAAEAAFRSALNKAKSDRSDESTAFTVGDLGLNAIESSKQVAA